MTAVTRTVRLDGKRRPGRTTTGGDPEARPATGADGGALSSGRDGQGDCEHVPAGRIPRISKLMALATRFDRLIQEGKIANQSELARLAHVTQPRMTQIMNLLHLAPDIQEAILDLPPVAEGRDPITERDVRPIAAETDWRRQRKRAQAVWSSALG